MIHRIAMLILAVAPLSCGKGDRSPESRPELFTDLCAQILSCDCEYESFADQGSCEQHYAVEYAEIAADLTVDAECNQAGAGSDAFQFRCETFSEYYSDHELDHGYKTCGACTYAYGTVAAGQPCVDHGDEISECARGLFCHEGVCIDTCEPLPLDAACNNEPRACAEGLFCDLAADRCAPVAEEGESCGEQPCASGLFCQGGVQAVCQPVQAAGGPCEGDHACEAGLKCVTSGDESACGPPLGAGEVCDMFDDDPCEAGLRCITTADGSACQSPFGAGEACDGFDTHPCEDGLICRPDGMGGQSCGTEPRLGEPCFFECERGAWCDDTGVCARLPSEGLPCINGECDIGYVCGEQDICVVALPLVCESYQ